MTRDFVFTAPVAFPHVVALAPERFRLWPSAQADGPSSLFVLALDANGVLDLDAAFAALASDALDHAGPVDWSLEPKQLLGRDARHAAASLSVAGAAESVEVVLVRGRDERPWVFGRRSREADGSAAAAGLASLLASLQERPGSTSAKLLESQFLGQEQKHRRLAEAGGRRERSVPDPFDPVWDRRLAAAIGQDEAAVVAPMIVDAVALVEEAYGDPVPIGASRIGGGPDLAPGAWPTNARGMRHPFLMQIDLADVAGTCGPMAPLPEAGLLSFFVHGDDLSVDVVHSPPGTHLIGFPMTAALIEASGAAIRLAEALPRDVGPGPLPHEEGDYVAASVQADGMLLFSHSPDPVWAHGTPGEAFDALSDERWACVASARLRPARTRSIDFASAQRRIDEEGVGSDADLEDVHEDLGRSPVGAGSDTDLPQIHQMLGYALFEGRQDCRQEAAEGAERDGHEDLADPEGWMVLARVNRGSTTGRVFWDALDLTVMAPVADVAAGRWDRCVLLPG